MSSSSTKIQTVLSAKADRRMHDLRYRQRQLSALHSWLVEHSFELEKVFEEEEKWKPSEATVTLISLLSQVRKHYESLSLKDELRQEYSVKVKKDNPGAREPYGLVCLVPNQHSLIFGAISALAAIIAAGNCCVIQLAPSTSRSYEFLQECLKKSVDQDAVALVPTQIDGGLSINSLLIDQTGDPALAHIEAAGLIQSHPGRLVVAVVDRTANLTLAVSELIQARCSFAGKSCYAPDVVLVNEFVLEEFEMLVVKHFEGEAVHNVKPQGLVSHVESASICRGRDRKYRITKIQGGDLILRDFTSLDHAIDTFDDNDEPLLALYVFAQPAQAKYLVQYIPSELASVNHIPIELHYGPTFPPGTSPRSPTRYTRAQMEVSRPKLVDAGQTGLSKAVDSSATLQRARSAAMRSLPPTGQRSAKATGFFDQAILAALGAYIGIPLALAGTAALWYVI